MTKRKFGQLELEILHILKQNKTMTVKQVQAILGDENKYTTVMTVMNRLTLKKVLERTKNGHQFEYTIQCEQEKIPSILDQIKNKIYGIKTSTAICYLLESAESISEEELFELESMIQKAREGRKKNE